MKFDNPRFTTVYHRNAWGQWTFTFEGVKLCGLEFQGGANPGSPKACAYAEPESEGKVRGRTAQVYHSANAHGLGTNSNHYSVDDAALDELIKAGRVSVTQDSTYAEIMIDPAVPETDQTEGDTIDA